MFKVGHLGKGTPVHQFLPPVPYPKGPVWLRQTLQPTSPFSPPTTALLWVPYSNHTSLPTLPQTQRYLPTSAPLLQPWPQPGTPCFLPCLANPTPLLVLSSQASPGGGLPPPERRLTRWHSGLLGPDGILPWWSVGCPPICLPSLQPQSRSALRVRPRMM